MHNRREKSSAGIIAVSAIITLLILGALTYTFFVYGIPVLPVTMEELYGILIRLLPVLIGLTLILIALALKNPPIPSDTDDQDELEKDAFTEPLYRLPDEQNRPVYGRSPLPVSPPRTDEEPAAPTEQKVADPTPEITPFAGVPKRSQTPTVIADHPQPVVEPEELTDEQFLPVSRAVLFSEYPFPIVPGSEIVQLLEPIEETEDETAFGDTDTVSLEDTFEHRLDEEFISATTFGYDISVALFAIPEREDDPHSVDATVVQDLFNRLGIIAFFYLTEAHQISAILPFYSFAQCRRVLAALLGQLQKQHPESTITGGFSSMGDRELSQSDLVQEAALASDFAAERGGYSLIGYDSSLEEN